MNPVIVIPARRGSTRLPDKMLLDIKGKPLIRWTVEAALKTGFDVMVVTDDPSIGEEAAIPYVLTGPCLNGTERCIAGFEKLSHERSLLINWQGDSPLTSPYWVQQLAEYMERSPYGVGTLHCPVNRQAMDGEVKVLTLPCGVADFQRARRGEQIENRHIGVYAIKRQAAELYGSVPSRAEMHSGLEQLRWVDRGVAVTSLEVTEDQPTIEINTDIDVGLFKTVLESADETH